MSAVCLKYLPSNVVPLLTLSDKYRKSAAEAMIYGDSSVPAPESEEETGRATTDTSENAEIQLLVLTHIFVFPAETTVTLPL